MAILLIVRIIRKLGRLFEISLHDTSKELIQMNFNSTCSYLSVIGFLVWITNTENATLKIISQLILGYGLSIYNQRIGSCNDDIFISDAGGCKFFDLLYAFKHLIYKEVGYSELRNKVLYPNEIYNLLSENILFSSSNNSGKWQGGDFVLEGKVKQQQVMAPKEGVIAKKWQGVSQFLEKTETVVANKKSSHGIENETTTRKILLEE